MTTTYTTDELIGKFGLVERGERDGKCWLSDEQTTWSAEVSDMDRATRLLCARIDARGGEDAFGDDEPGGLSATAELYGLWCSLMRTGQEDYSIFD